MRKNRTGKKWEIWIKYEFFNRNIYIGPLIVTNLLYESVNKGKLDKYSK